MCSSRSPEDTGLELLRYDSENFNLMSKIFPLAVYIESFRDFTSSEWQIKLLKFIKT